MTSTVVSAAATANPRPGTDDAIDGGASGPVRRDGTRPGVDGAARPLGRIEHGWWGVLLVAVAAFAGAGPVGDNSFLTHWATGRLILDGNVPHVDPYTFTAAGRAWTVQSWGASVLYGVLEVLGGAAAIRLAVAAATAAVVGLLWRLSRPAGGLVGRILLVGMAAAVGFSWWSERPQVFAFVCMGLTALVLVEERPAWWMVPLFAVWINLHGSFPLGLLLIAVWGTQRAVAARRVDRRAARVAVAAAAGAVAGAAMSPYGLDLLVFPLHMLRQGDSLRYIVEWRRPGLGEWYTIVFAAQVLGVVVVTVRSRRWPVLVPLACFVGLAATSARNVPVASIALVALGASAFSGVGQLRVGPPPARRALLVAGAVVASAVVGGVAVTTDLDVGAYPVRTVDRLEARGWVANPDVRLLTHDYVGNYLEWRFGASANTWIDDRAELLPHRAVEDYVTLLTAGADHSGVLDRYRANVVVWNRDEELADELPRMRGWRVVSRDRHWVSACRVGALVGC